jgi:hypothetical protein
MVCERILRSFMGISDIFKKKDSDDRNRDSGNRKKKSGFDAEKDTGMRRKNDGGEGSSRQNDVIAPWAAHEDFNNIPPVETTYVGRDNQHHSAEAAVGSREYYDQRVAVESGGSGHYAQDNYGYVVTHEHGGWPSTTGEGYNQQPTRTDGGYNQQPTRDTTYVVSPIDSASNVWASPARDTESVVSPLTSPIDRTSNVWPSSDNYYINTAADGYGAQVRQDGRYGEQVGQDGGYVETPNQGVWPNQYAGDNTQHTGDQTSRVESPENIYINSVKSINANYVERSQEAFKSYRTKIMESGRYHDRIGNTLFNTYKEQLNDWVDNANLQIRDINLEHGYSLDSNLIAYKNPVPPVYGRDGLKEPTYAFIK